MASECDTDKTCMILRHRVWLANYGVANRPIEHSLKKVPGKFLFESGAHVPPPGVNTTFKTSVPSGLRPISMVEVDESEEKIYKNRVLHLTLIEDPIEEDKQTTVVGRDMFGVSVVVIIQKLPQNDEVLKLLAFGTELGVINPSSKIGELAYIGVGGAGQIVHLGKKENLCRYCMEENASKRCANCKANYCSRSCQLADWKELRHKVLCKSEYFCYLQSLL